MRKIKFRGKSLETDDWVYGYLADGNLICTWDNIRNCHEVLSITVGQLTGLTDKNGKEIYEGDIIDVHIPCNSIGKEEHRTRVVVWDEKCARFEFQDKRGNCIADSVGAKYNVVYYEVIGNVFDNPELLEEGGDKRKRF